MPDIHYIPAPERIQSQDTKNKQGSSGELRSGVVAGFLANTQQDQANVYRNYETALGDGVAREIARINTPVSRYSKMWAKANLRNWLHFLDLRERPNAQEEIRVFADAVAQIVMDLYPRTYALFEEHTLYAKKLSRTDVQKLREILGMLHPADTEAAAILAKLT
jgi:thymidylate synthase (FAD)